LDGLGESVTFMFVFLVTNTRTPEGPKVLI
jgi:hypothetical protein